LAHSNPGVVLSATKIVLMYLNNLEAYSDKARSLTRKLAPPLISLMNNEPEIQYVAIKNINLILQKWPGIFEKEVRVFFCSF
jgi:AP-1 complex subunit beta-1